MKHPYLRTLLLTSTALVMAAPAPVASAPNDKPAAEASGSTIAAIRIEGNQRVEQKTILSYLGITAGNPFRQNDINDALKRLFGTGFFADVKLVRQGNDLVVRVVENPIINRVNFEGNDRISSEDMEKEIELKPRAIYTLTRLQNDVKRILDLYRRSGRYTATVEPKLIQLDQNRVDLAFEISEGPVARVEKITFIGNEMFSDRDLTKAIRTEETRWYKFLTDDDKYDPDRLAYDQELLRRYYVSQGYADFQVKSAHAELSPDKQAFFLTFVVEEGVQYQLSSASVASELKTGQAPDFSHLLTTRAGDTYDASKVDESIELMTKELGNLGFAFVDIAPKLTRNQSSKTIDLTYAIRPGPRVYVERINIIGNVRTLDEVIRREFRLVEGDPYNASKLQRTEERLKNLGFFEKVEINTEPGSAPDKTNITVQVTEKSTGEINFGAGYSTADGAIGDIGIKETNFLGKGQEVRTRFTLASRRKQAEVGFTEPHFMNRELMAGFDIYRTQMDYERESSYNFDIKGVTLRTGYAIREKFYHTITYTLRENNITDISPDASVYIRAQAGMHVTSMLGHAFIYDGRNNKFDPSNGYYIRVGQDFAGLGGDAKYIRHEIKAAYYYPIAKDWVFSTLGSAGHMFGLNGKDIRINDRFFIGGETIRGFRNSGLGARDTSTRDALGGNMYYAGTVEMLFPLGLPEELGLRGAVFADAGSLWSIDDVGPNISDSNTLRSSVGAGVAWASPFGPIRIDMATALSKENVDRVENLRFSFGTRF